MFTLPRPIIAAALLMLAGTLALPAHAATTAKTMQKSEASTMADRVETRIKTLHDKLQITADQEDAWGKVASAMRDNETSIKALIDDRHTSASSMSAVDDLKSYGKIAQAHADGIEKVADSFSPLYDNMTDAQKKNADEVFGTYEGHRGAKAMHKASAKKSSAAPAATTAPQGE